MTKEVGVPMARNGFTDIPAVLGSRRAAVEQALRTSSYEVLPLRSAEDRSSRPYPGPCR